MNPVPDSRPAMVERLFTLGSATMFILLMGAVVWALAAPTALLK